MAGLSEAVNEAIKDPNEAKASYGIELEWLSGTRSKVRTLPMQLGNHKINRSFDFEIDEPNQLLGINSAPNPAEYLLGGLAGCMCVTFMAGATLKGIQIESLKIQIKGDLDLSYFFGLKSDTHAGFPELNIQFIIDGDGTKEQYSALIEKVRNHSPNFCTINNAVSCKTGFLDD